MQAAWQKQFVDASKTLGLTPTLLQQGQELLPRFSSWYSQLQSLPRRVRRLLQRKLKQSLAGAALLLALGHLPAEAATINVSGSCTLIDAITAANTNTATGGCTAGNGNDTIKLPTSSMQTLTSVNNTENGANGLPVIRSTITIEGQGSTIRRDGLVPAFRIFFVNNTGNLELRATTVSGGIATGVVNDSRGGGVFNKGSLTLINSTISGNSALVIGGGVHNDSGMTLLNSTVSGNTASEDGGGIFNNGSANLNASNSTISGNTASDDGGGIFNLGTLALARTLISGNAASLGPEVDRSLGNVTINNHNLFGYDGDAGVVGFSPGLTDVVPASGVFLNDILAPLADNGGPTLTHALILGSPAIDASPDDGNCLDTDQRGVSRPQGLTCDIGAFEFDDGVVPPGGVGGSVTEMSPTTGKVTCRNLTTKKMVKITLPAGVRQWDCEQAGLVVNPGNNIKQTITVTGPAD
jgi:hypothetical protein